MSVAISQDPSLFIRNSGIAGVAYNTLQDSFVTNRNKEHKRPLPPKLEIIQPAERPVQP